MARTLDEIYNNTKERFITNVILRTFYDIADTKSFDEHFSTVSLEAQLMYVVAYSVWTLETLFDTFQEKVTNMLADLKPHTARWYRVKTMAFQKDYVLAKDSDVYDVIDEEAKVVKYADAVEPPDTSKLLVKIAGGASGQRDKLSDDVAIQVFAYLQSIKDAGVRIELVNLSPDNFKCEVDIYFNAMLLPNDIESSVHNVIVNYIETLDFNSEFSNMALIDTIQKLPGVMLAELLSSSSKPANSGLNFSLINAKRIPDAGYFRAYSSDDIVINMIAYELA